MPEPDNVSDAELAETLTGQQPAEKPTEAIVKTAPPLTAAEALSKAIAPLAEKSEQTLAVAARGILDVQPPAAYVGGSELVLSESDEQKLKELSTPTDDDIDIRPDGGMVYVTHMFYRRVLTEVFGRGQWCEIPASPPDLKRESGSHRVYQAWQLKVRGCFIRSSVGSSRYFPDSPTANLSDALESACSDALTRNAAKGSLGIATEPWIRKEREAWKKEYAVRVWCKVKSYGGGTEDKMLWRRKDADPLEGEIRVVEPAGQKKPKGEQEAQAADKQPETAPQPPAVMPAAPLASAKPPVKAKTPPPPAKTTTPEPATPLPPPAPATQTAPGGPPPQPLTEDTRAALPSGGAVMVAEPQIRLFFALARRDKCKLIEGENAGGAVVWIAEKTELDPAELKKIGSGKKSTELAVNLLRRLTMKKFHDEILPALRKQYGL